MLIEQLQVELHVHNYIGANKICHLLMTDFGLSRSVANPNRCRPMEDMLQNI